MKKKNIKLFFEEVIINFWKMVIIPFCCLILVFLGALNGTYHYDSTMQQELNYTLGVTGVSLYNSMYLIGYESPKLWLTICLIVLVGGFIFWILEIQGIKWIKKDSEEDKDTSDSITK